MRYLCYFGRGREIKLKHPGSLISGAFRECKVTNLGQCANIRNLFTRETKYSSQDFDGLAKLARFYSYNDEYKAEGSCLMQ